MTTTGPSASELKASTVSDEAAAAFEKFMTMLDDDESAAGLDDDQKVMLGKLSTD